MDVLAVGAQEGFGVALIIRQMLMSGRALNLLCFCFCVVPGVAKTWSSTDIKLLVANPRQYRGERE